MAFKTYEKVFISLFVIFAAASGIWWGITGSVLAAAGAIASGALVLVSVILFIGSALERRSGEDHNQSFVEGAHFARELMGDAMHYWTQNQIATQRTAAQLARNDGHLVKAMSGTMAAYGRQIMGLVDDLAGVKAQAQAQQQPDAWWDFDDDVTVDADEWEGGR